MFNLNTTFRPSNLFDLVENFLNILDAIIPILIGLAVLLFIYGLLKYVISKDQQARRDAINVIIYGIVTLFIMVSVWSIVEVIANTFDIDTGGWIGNNHVPIDNLIIKK